MRECCRCRRSAPDRETAEFAAWLTGDRLGSNLVCPGCLTRSEADGGDDDLTIALMEIDMIRDDGPPSDDGGQR
jgi:hypothetical protein